MNRFLRPRKTIPDSLERQLNSYALMAGAAGVSVLASACSAEAKIIYTPAHVRLEANSRYLLDVNNDGTRDFELFVFGNRSSIHASSLQVAPYYGNKVLDSRGQLRFPRDLKAGFVIGPWARNQFSSKGLMALIATYSGYIVNYTGLWANGGKGVTNRYLGLQFQINGKNHHGWARLNVSFSGSLHMLEATLTGYAYETIPGKAIIAGATEGPDDAEPTASLNTHSSGPATLGALALGAPGLTIWRREESVASALGSN